MWQLILIYSIPNIQFMLFKYNIKLQFMNDREEKLVNYQCSFNCFICTIYISQKQYQISI